MKRAIVYCITPVVVGPSTIPRRQRGADRIRFIVASEGMDPNSPHITPLESDLNVSNGHLPRTVSACQLFDVLAAYELIFRRSLGAASCCLAFMLANILGRHPRAIQIVYSSNMWSRFVGLSRSGARKGHAK